MTSRGQLGLFPSTPGEVLITTPLDSYAPAGPYCATIAEASPGDDVDVWFVRVVVVAGDTASVWRVVVDSLRGRWRTCAELVTGTAWRAAREAARAAGKAHAREQRTLRLRGVRTCSCGDRYVPKSRGRLPARCPACQRKARSAAFAEKARAKRATRVGETSPDTPHSSTLLDDVAQLVGAALAETPLAELVADELRAAARR